jgi:hypothetical protein
MAKITRNGEILVFDSEVAEVIKHQSPAEIEHIQLLGLAGLWNTKNEDYEAAKHTKAELGSHLHEAIRTRRDMDIIEHVIRHAVDYALEREQSTTLAEVIRENS